jgi:ureidoacrylate peracid hydrolase
VNDGSAPFEKTALLLCDLQNDFLHPRGAYGRAGLATPEIATLPARLAPLADLFRRRQGWIISTHFTLVPAKGGEPLIAPHLRTLRPFLGKGDFLPGAWGHALIDELAPADLTVEKVAYSAFYMTRLEWLLRKTGIEKIYVAGIVTNGGVASTIRDAHARDFETILLADGCAAFSRDVHETAVAALASVAVVATVGATIETLGVS